MVNLFSQILRYRENPSAFDTFHSLNWRLRMVSWEISRTSMCCFNRWWRSEQILSMPCRPALRLLHDQNSETMSFILNYRLMFLASKCCYGRRFTSENVTVRNCPALSMSFCKFAAITTISLPSTNPAPTSSAAIPSAESTPTANSNLMSLSSRFWFLNRKRFSIQ